MNQRSLGKLDTLHKGDLNLWLGFQLSCFVLTSSVTPLYFFLGHLTCLVPVRRLVACNRFLLEFVYLLFCFLLLYQSCNCCNNEKTLMEEGIYFGLRFQKERSPSWWSACQQAGLVTGAGNWEIMSQTTSSKQRGQTGTRL